MKKKATDTGANERMHTVSETKKTRMVGSFLVVQWFGLDAFLCQQDLVDNLRSHKPQLT